MTFVNLEGISKRYGKTAAVKMLDLSVGRGEFFSLLGPSGCGKTTTLRMLAGFVTPDTGHIEIAGHDITRLPPEARDIGIVFQNYAIFPHMSVFDNIAFGLKMRKVDRDTIRTKVEAVLRQVGLAGFGDRFERQLSGGQKQRVALARVLVFQPQILLLDEPLSALDKKMREEMKFWIKDIQKSVGITTIYVTHDQGEALTMSDRIAVMRDGEVLQIGSPKEIYELPATRFIGEFIGESNLIDGTVRACGADRCEVDLEGAVLTARAPAGASLAAGDRVSVLIRPEAITLGRPANGQIPRLTGRIVSETYQGAVVRYAVRTGAYELTVEVPNRLDARHLDAGEDVGLFWNDNSAVALR